ncbi:MAG: FmdB family zinc ribbon protein [Egibacteraceae bacterium]
MPTYEYVCRDCARHLEVVQSFRDSALTTCGTCGGPLRKVFSAAGIIFKGSGYYVTDARDKKPPKPARTKEPSGTEEPAGAKPKDESSSSGSAEASTAESA